MAQTKKRRRKYKKRTGYLRLNEIELRKKTFTIWGYSKAGKLVGRLVVNLAGVEAFVGTKRGRSLGNLSWEKFFKRLEPPKKKK